jgi:ClpP class serine protease
MFTLFIETPTTTESADRRRKGFDARRQRGQARQRRRDQRWRRARSQQHVQSVAAERQFRSVLPGVLRQIGVALELPFELLIKHFTASYSASRAALEMAWQFSAAAGLAWPRAALQPVYEWMMEEAVAPAGSIVRAFSDPVIRKAYCGAEWIGPQRASLNPYQEAQADALDIENRLQDPRAGLHGAHRRRVREEDESAKAERMILRAEIAQRIFDTPLLMHEGKLIAAMTAVGGRIVEGGMHFDGSFDLVDHTAFEGGRPSLGRLGDRLGRAYERAGETPYDVIESVAVIPVEGSLVHKGAYVGMSSGRTSYQGLQTQVRRAQRDDRVKAAVFEVDSYGGEASGAFETADMIAQLSRMKPTIAILTDHAYSAGYLLASAARQIVAPANGGAGSIGAVAMHADLSKKLEKDGITVTVLAAGKHKSEGNPFQPLPDDVKARSLARLESSRGIFAEAVGRFRGSRFNKAAALQTEADSYTGVEAAEIGMIDAVGSPSEAFDAFIAEINRKR